MLGHIFPVDFIHCIYIIKKLHAHHGEDGTKNGVGIVLSEDMRDRVLAVERTCDSWRLKARCGTSSAVTRHKWDAHKRKTMSSGSTWTQRCKRYQEARGWSWRET